MCEPVTHMTTYFDWVLRHRLTVLLITIVVSLASAVSVSRAVIASSVGEMFFGDAAPYHRYLEKISLFGSDEFIVISYDDPDPLSKTSLDKLEQATGTIEDLPDIARVTSLLNTQRIRSAPDGLVVESWAEAARSAPDERSQLMDELAADQRQGLTLLGRSRRRAAVVIELKVNPNRTGENAPRLLQNVVDAFEDAGFAPDTVHRAGQPAIIAECMKLTQHSLGTIFPIVLVVMLTIVVVLFRSALPLALAAAVSVLSVLWTLGLTTAFDPKLNVFHGIVPAVVTIVAISDVIHLWSAYLHGLAQGLDKMEAVQRSAEDVGKACLLTSVTTFVGFVSMALIPTPMFQEIGWVLGLGVATALLLAMTMVPIVASIGRTPSIRARKMDNPVARLVDQITAASAHLSTKHPRTIIVAFGLIAVVTGWGAAQSTLETAFIRRFDPEHPIRKDAEIFEQEYAGTQSLDVFISAPEPEALFDPELVQSLARFEAELEAIAGVDTALSYVDLIRSIHEALDGSGELPDSREALAQYLLLFELGGGDQLDQIIDFDRRQTRIALRLNEDRMRATWEVGEQAKALAQATLPDGIDVEATGLAALTGGWLDEIVRGQRLAVMLSFFAISILMCIGLGSIRIGVLSMIPNLLPLLVLLGTCGWMWREIDSDTSVALMMAIGIGVDDTIHFLMRYRIESGRAPDEETAIKNTFGFAGRAIVMTTVALALGYAPFVMSEYYSTHILGTLLPYTLVVAMLADLLLVPAFIRVGWLRFPSPPAPTRTDAAISA